MKIILIFIQALISVKSDNTSQSETYEFQSETSRLMEIIINSLYTQKDVFLRELISNAADACDKIRFLSVTQPEMLSQNPDLTIQILFNKDEQTLTIQDSGLGMTKQDLISNLGTLARSGTTNFLQQIKNGDMNLIGQFGVGFYSAFLVADSVEVYSKSYDGIGHLWTSSNAHQFTIKEYPEFNQRGTKIVLHLKHEAMDYLSESKLQQLIKHYSEFIIFPIYLQKKKSQKIEVDLTLEEIEEQERKNLELPEDQQKQDLPTRKNITQVEDVLELQNQTMPIWLQDKTEVTEEAYNQFYQGITKDTMDPIGHLHFRGEGEVEFSSLIYVPNMPNEYNMQQAMNNKQDGIKLYVRRVLIQDKFDKLLPTYLSFVRGVIDSDDLPLNVSRETLQESRTLQTISKKLTKKVIDMLIDICKDDKKQDLFWKAYNKQIKVGLTEDDKFTSKLLKLVRFKSTRNQTELVSFDKYLSRTVENQDKIYYLGGENANKIMENPILQSFIQKNIEVLIFDEALDEYIFQKHQFYEGKQLVNIAKGNIDLPKNDDERKRFKALKKVFEPVTSWLKSIRSSSIQSVEISQKLVNDPFLVVSTLASDSANLQRVFKAQAYYNYKPQDQKKIVEINPNHPILKRMLETIQSGADLTELERQANDLLDIAWLNSGFSLENFSEFANRIYGQISVGMGNQPDDGVSEFQVDFSTVTEEELKQPDRELSPEEEEYLQHQKVYQEMSGYQTKLEEGSDFLDQQNERNQGQHFNQQFEDDNQENIDFEFDPEDKIDFDDL